MYTLSIKNCFILCALLLTACRKTTVSPILSDPSKFALFLQNVPLKQLERNANIQFVFTERIPESLLNSKANLSSLLSIKPELKGEFAISDPMKLEFIPESGAIDPKVKYHLSLNLQKVFPTITDSFRIYNTSVQFAPMFLDVDTEYPTASLIDEDKVTFDAKIITNMQVSDEQIRKYVLIKLDNKELHSYTLVQLNPLEWAISVGGIEQTEEIRNFVITWRSLPEMNDQWESEEFDINPKNEFTVTGVKVFKEPSKMITIYLSDRIDPLLDLRGIVSMSADDSNIRVQNEGNKINVFVSENMHSESVNLDVALQLKNTYGQLLNKSYSSSIVFSEAKPRVKFVDSKLNSILPLDNEAIVGIQAINLTKVDVEIFKIFSNNVLYNLHFNEDFNMYQSSKLGRIIHQETIVLDKADEDEWVSYGLNISTMVKSDPGAMYEIRLTFKPEYTAYQCNDKLTIPVLNAGDYDTDDIIRSNWVDYWPYRYFESDEENVNYNGEDPCSLNYYTSRNFVRKNILSSNLCIQAKQSKDKKNIQVVALNNLSAKQIESAKIDVYDKQLQLLKSSKTNSEGICNVNVAIPAAYIVASSDGHSSYLSLNESKSLSLSEFDVEGVNMTSMIKSCIYAERDIWRPGDSIFVNIVLYKNKEQLPPELPIQLEFINPKGVKLYSKVVTNAKLGLYSTVIPTSTSYITGKYQLVCNFANEQVRKNYWIEAIKPNRFKVEWQIPEFTSDNIKQAELKFQSKYLHGAVAGNMSAKVDFITRRIAPKFKDRNAYTFLNPEIKTDNVRQTVFDGELNANGEAKFNFKNLNFATESGIIEANLVSRVQDKAGDISTEKKSFLIKPFSEYIGIKIPESPYGKKLDSGSDQWIEIICVDNNGSALSNRKVEIDLFKVSYEWWYEVSFNNSNYMNESYKSKLENKTLITDANGKIKYKVNLNTYDRFFIRAKSKNSNYSSGEYFYTGWPMDEQNNDFASIIHFKSDKEVYKVGEMAKIQLPQAKDATYLVHLIKQDKILKTFTIDSKKGQSSVNFEITDEMLPNIYIDLSIIQKTNKYSSDLPLRLYGFLPISVVDPKTKLEPKIDVKETIEPGEEFVVTISESSKSELAYQLFIVDEGLLGLTNYSVPDIHSEIFSKEALAIFSFDNFNQVVGVRETAYKNIFSIGGDKSALPKELEKMSERFTPVVINGGSHILKPNERKQHKFKINNFIGAVRVMAIANSKSAVGSSEKTVLVKSDLMTEVTLPKVININDEIAIPFSIFNYSKSKDPVTVTFESSANIKIAEAKQKTIQFGNTSEQVVFFNAKVDEFEGRAFVKAIVEAGKNKSSHQLDFTIVNPNPIVTEASSLWIEPNQEIKIDLSTDRFSVLNEVSMEVSKGLATNLTQIANSLLLYPHGCLEQVSSAAFPQVFLPKIVSLNASDRERVNENIMQAFSKLKLFQNSDGAFSYWPGMGSASEWASSYAAHFLLEANKNGYASSSSMLNSWLKYATLKATNYQFEKSSYSDIVQAYRLYVMCKSGKTDFAAMNRLHQEKLRSNLASWILAGAFAVSGKIDIANSIVNNSNQTISNYRDSYYTYGSSFRDQCMIALMLAELKRNDEAKNLLLKISKKSMTLMNYTTQELAFFILAVEKVFGTVKDNELLEFTYQDNGKAIPVRQKAFLSINKFNKDQKYTVVKNLSKDKIHVSIVQKGKLKNEFYSVQSNGIDLKYQWLNAKGLPIDFTSLKQGDDVKLKVEIMNMGIGGDLKNLALTVVLPPGLENRNERFLFNHSAPSELNYQDIRDDRILSYFDLNVGQKKTIELKLTAAYKGRFAKSAVICEAMYDPSIYARNYIEPVVVLSK
ncbi:MAG: hypothetical protein IPJ43_06720 [Saprospiraceae bacterium]|nr:hypothetical protein [Saprospiraceae bacterium]